MTKKDYKVRRFSNKAYIVNEYRQVSKNYRNHSIDPKYMTGNTKCHTLFN